MVLLRKKHNKRSKRPRNERGRSGIDHRPCRRLAVVVAIIVSVTIVAGAGAGNLIRDGARRQHRRVGLSLRLDLSAADRDPLRDGGYAIDCDEEHCGSTNMASVAPPPTRAD